MVKSLNKIRSLPDDTKIYCAHEYTEANSRFANHLTPDDSLLKKKIIEIKKKRSKNIPTIPSTLSEEKKLNPFLKFDDKSYLDSIGMDFISSSINFGRIRKLKDDF
jgi:hydroxyacylglutathione hydrolase